MREYRVKKHGSIKRLLAFVMAVAMIVSYVPSMQRVKADGALSYVDAFGNACSVTDYVAITSENAPENWENGWYAVTENVTIEDRIIVTGDVNLILCDGALFTANSGISVTEGNSLTIWQQSAGTGSLYAEATGAGNAGIGGSRKQNCGGSVTINGGVITAVGAKDAAGIGGGRYGKSGTIIINGGTVTAHSRYNGAAIGGGSRGDGGSIAINGGTVIANSDETGCGIGAGYLGKNGDVEITGGKVQVFLGDAGVAIGATSGASVLLDGMKMLAGADQASSTLVAFEDRKKACRTSKYVELEVCDHSAHVPIITTWQHAKQCAYCGEMSEYEDHVFGNDDKCSCGFSRRFAYVNDEGTSLISDGCELISDDCNVLSGGFAAAAEDVTLTDGLTVSSDTNLILCDDVTMIVPSGITVAEGAKLTVWLQTKGTGKLIVHGGIKGSLILPKEAKVVAGASENGAEAVLTNERLTACQSSDYVRIEKCLTHELENGFCTHCGYGDQILSTAYVNVAGTLQDPVSCLRVVPSITEWNDGWYAVTQDVVYENRVSAVGEVNLILCDGATLTAKKGIVVNETDSLTIWQQEEGTGALIASSEYGNAAIGGDAGHSAGTINVYGGNITANSVTLGDCGAGIGGGRYGNGGTVCIYGGTVTTTGGTGGAGIGGGMNGAGGSVLITGGTVTASSKEMAAGIGGGKYGAGGSIRILGGNVSAFCNYAGTGIGAGLSASGATITLGWTNLNDVIYASSYNGTVSFVEGALFQRCDTKKAVTVDEIGGTAIEPRVKEAKAIHLVTAGIGELVANADQAIEGQTVHLTLSMEYPQDFGSLTVTDQAGNDVNVTQEGKDSFSFVMPSSEVTVRAEFVTANATSVSTSEGVKSCLPIMSRYAGYGEGWYVVTKDITISERVYLSGDVKVFLCEGTTLTCSQGITVSEGDCLTIEGTGTLIADASDFNCGAGIGTGWQGCHLGTIRIKGGVIKATGSMSGLTGAGIGGSSGDGESRTSNGGIIEITGGTVIAVGGPECACIGGGSRRSGGTISITGGKVTAIGEDGSIGIGNGLNGEGGTILLGWTNEDDFIEASSYSGSVSYADNKYFRPQGKNELARADNIDGVRILPCPKVYTVNINTFENGSVTADKTLAMEGETVTLSAFVQYPHRFEAISVTGASGTVDLTNNADGTFSFVMPRSNVSVNALFPMIDTVKRTIWSQGVTDCLPLCEDVFVYYEGCYVVTKDLTLSERVIMNGDVKLYLDDGATLTCSKGISVTKGNTFTIDGEGSLVANAGGEVAAGIGGDETNGETGRIIIHGGNITARGSEKGAGIGSAFASRNSSTIIINGGTVTAYGSFYSSGIGTGFEGYDGLIRINGGSVTAEGNYGIGGDGASVELLKGNVVAEGLNTGGIGGAAVLIDTARSSDSYQANSYVGNVSFGSGGFMIVEETGEYATAENIAGKRLIATVAKLHSVNFEGSETYVIPRLSSLAQDLEIPDYGLHTYKVPTNFVVRIEYPYDVTYEESGIEVRDENGDLVEVTSYGNGVFSFVMPNSSVFIKTFYTNRSLVSRMTSEGEKQCLPVDVRYTSWRWKKYEGWYALTEDLEIDHTIYVYRNAKLFLDEGKTLKCYSIIVDENVTLTIEGEGTLIVDSGINCNYATVIIRGGNIVATGGQDRAAIGGSINSIENESTFCNGHVRIEGGNVMAIGSNFSAAIGACDYQEFEEVTITGGTVNAIAGEGGAGIGGGYRGLVRNITITGGVVNAQGGKFGGAGIGGGYNASAGNITITGGVVTAAGGMYKNQDFGAGIGSGAFASGAYGGGGSIEITGGQVTATGGSYQGKVGGGIGNGWDSSDSTTITLGWTNPDDFIEASSYVGTISFAEGQDFWVVGEDVVTQAENAGGIRIVPYKECTVAVYSRLAGASSATVANVSVTPSGKVLNGTQVTAVAPDKSAEGFRFLGWFEVTQLSADESQATAYADEKLCDQLSYTFEVFGDTKVVAVYEAVGEAQVTIRVVNDAQYLVGESQTKQSGSTEFVGFGTELALTAVDTDKVLFWMNESNKILGTKTTLRFTVTGNTSVTLVYLPKDSDSAFVQFVSNFGQVLSYGMYGASDAILFPTQPSKFGSTFVKWVFKGTDEEATENAIKARVANGGVITVVPKYVQDDKKYDVTVRYQDGNGAEISADVQYPDILVGTGYTVTAPAVDGYAFSCWKDSNGTILGYNESYYFLVASDNSLTAVYAADGSAQQTQAQPVITIGVPSAVTTTDAHKVSCTVTRSIPDGYELQEHGILYAKGVEGLNETTFVYGTAGVSKYMSDKTSTSGVVKLNVKVSGATISSGDNMNVSFRGYMILKDNATGNVATYYTDIVSGNYAALNTQN